MPELGHNALESMLRVLLQLERSPLLGHTPSKLVYSIREMSSSRAGFVVPDRCETMIDLHLSPDTDPAAVRRELESLLIESRRAIKGLELEFEFAFESGGYQLGPDKIGRAHV